MAVILNEKLFYPPYSEIKEYGQDNLIYGSLTQNGIESLVKYIEKYIPGYIYGMDLGCGDGELLYHLQTLLPNSTWEGVEISEHRISMKVRDVCIWQGDMLLENYKPYTIIHADNLCLTPLILDKLEEKLSIEFSGLYISYVYPKNINLLRKIIFLDKIQLEATWGIHSVYLFRINA
jgi:hypothetical protein